MKKRKLLLLLGVAMASTMAFGQSPTHPRYVKSSSNTKPFYQAYQSWTPGTPLFSGDAEVAADEEFFISRVKPRARFVNAETQVDRTMDSGRKLLWWCPIGVDEWNALPNYFFDSEVFSMWSYVDHYGNWTAPFIRMPGAFADICHKNGVSTSVLASVPWAATIKATDNEHGSNMKAMVDGGADKLLKFLRYYGIDGIGYNSEFNIGEGLSAAGLKGLLGDAFSKRNAANWPTFGNAWYSLMTNGGAVGGGSTTLNSTNKDWLHYNGNPTSDGYFLNYGWGSAALSTSQSTAQSFGRDPFDVYGGMDYQGRSIADWISLKEYKISVGIWGAHNMNMLFEGRGELGSSPLQMQNTYQLISENSFTGSSFNPVNTPPITNLLAHTSKQTKFHGFSSFITARSALTTDDLAKEPFITYFNLGNGLFFNVDGETKFPNQWYNIGIQDHLPTWRWWWTSTFMGRLASEVPLNGLKAEFTWDDAWFGGSCLKISGQTNLEYLQLFKTKYALQTGDKLTIRYKVSSGSGKLTWICAAQGEEATPISPRAMNLTSGKEWIETTVSVGAGTRDLKMNGKTLALLGLKFEETTSDFNVLIGEISLTREDAPAPIAPTVTGSKLLGRNYQGLDFNVYFKMKDRELGKEAEPVYNADVNTWYFKVYMQQEGKDPQFCTATTSWASYVVAAPYVFDGSKNIRVGVSAVSIDGKSESAITWSNYAEYPALTVTEGIEIDKPIIKKDEEFTIKFSDFNHSPAKEWKILNAQTGAEVSKILNATEIKTSMNVEGIYDLSLTFSKNGKDTTEYYPALIQVSPAEVGAFPQINTLKANGSTDAINVEKDAEVTFTYEGRNADGYVSRGLRLPEKAFTVPAAALGFSNTSPFTMSFWFKPDRFNHQSGGTHFLNIRTREDGWPASDWGFVWSEIEKNGKLSINFRDVENKGNGFKENSFTFLPGQWYHMAVVCGYENGRSIKIYINGRLLPTTITIPSNKLYPWRNSNMIMLGGNAFDRAALDGYLDEFQIWNKALTDAEVERSMKHFEPSEVPAALVGYWDFENEAVGNKIMSVGSNKTLYGNMQLYGEKDNIFDLNFATGAPFISGTVFRVETKPSWTLDESTLVEAATGNSSAGQVKVKYETGGVYTATLTLANGWGSVDKTFSFVTVTDNTAIEDMELEAAYRAAPNPFYNEVNVHFANAGDYLVEILDVNGKRMSITKASLGAGDILQIPVQGAAGTYFVNIRNGKTIIKALKVIKK